MVLWQSKQNQSAAKKLVKEINTRHQQERKNFETQIRREYKQTKERWKQELSSDESTTKRQRDASLQYVPPWLLDNFSKTRGIYLLPNCGRVPHYYLFCLLPVFFS